MNDMTPDDLNESFTAFAEPGRQLGDPVTSGA
jgi:hypothetical protein